MLLRPALPTDQAALADLYLRTRRATFTWRNPEDFQLSDFPRDTEGEQIHLAESEDGTLLGFLSLWEPDKFIHHLFISPDHLRQGIGQALLADLHQRLPGPFRLKCLTANLPALAFYHSLGWAETEHGTSDDGDYMLMESPTHGRTQTSIEMPDIDDKLLEAYERLGIKVGDIFEDCSFHPVLCLGVDYQEDEIWGVSLIDGSYPRSCSLLHCGVRKLSAPEAWQIKLTGPSDEVGAASIAPERRWWNANPTLKQAPGLKGIIPPRRLLATPEEAGPSTS